MIELAIASFLSITISFLSVRFLSGFFKGRLVDIPNQRSSHKLPTPRGGGLGFIISFYVVSTVISFFPGSNDTIPYIAWVAALPLILVGFLDDWKDLPSSIRYSIQLIYAVIIVQILGYIDFLPNISLFNSLNLINIINMLITVISITAFINFYNFMDGLDGLVSGVAIIQITYLAFWTGSPVLCILVCSILGFIYWNWQPARIFMGDAGSTFIGAAIATAILSKHSSLVDIFTTATITLPILVDTIYTLIRRATNKENIFQAHRSHIFQRLNKIGWSHSKVSGVYILASIIFITPLFFQVPYAAIVNIIVAFLFLFTAEMYLSKQEAII